MSDLNIHQDPFHGVNPAICDSSTFYFSDSEIMRGVFDGEVEGCYLYARHSNPTTAHLGAMIAQMEGSEAGLVTASGMAAISCVMLQLCSAGDEIVASRTIYGGTYALFKNIFPRFGITVHLIDTNDLAVVESACNERTKVIYCETLSNPLLDVADIPGLKRVADKFGAKLVIDNTFTPVVISPLKHGADIVIHSVTKYINGSSDCVAGAICCSQEFMESMISVSDGTSMLLGPTLDTLRAASIAKNLQTLPVRMKQHSENGFTVANHLEKLGHCVFYPGLASHKHHDRMTAFLNCGWGYSGMLAVDLGGDERARQFMGNMQRQQIGFLAVSLGYHKTLFSCPGKSTSSEIPEDVQAAMGLTGGFVRLSMGLETNSEEVARKIAACMP